MRILILNCDLDSSNETNGAAVLQRHLKGKKVRVDIAHVHQNKFPKVSELSGYDSIIITGSRASVYEKKRWLARLGNLVREIDRQGINTLGICFGYQMVAQALGGMVQKGVGYEEGFGRVQLTAAGREDFVFRNFPARFLVYQSHGDIAKVLPQGAQILSKNKNGVQAFKLRSFRCVQFHPEILPKTAVKMYRRDGKDTRMITRIVDRKYSLPANTLSNFVGK
jgi:GMP synthase-like glutamine amidotransferase